MSVLYDSILLFQRKVINMCEDFPCCGHEMNDCDGSLYGSDESIKERAINDRRGEYANYWGE